MVKKSQNKKPKKKLGLFYKVAFSVLLLAFITLFYFVVLVSTEPKSFPFVTQTIQERLEKKFGKNAAIENSYISFTRYGTLKITATSLKILYVVNEKSDKQAFIIPRLETEFSLMNLLLLRFQPTKIKLINPNIIIDDPRNIAASQDENLEQANDLSLIMGILSSIRQGNLAIENFEIENAKLMIRGHEFKNEILLKKSQIQVSIKNEVLNFSSQNLISFNPKAEDVNLSSSCALSKLDGLKCDLALENFIPHSISSLSPFLTNLSKISGSYNGNVSLAVKEGELVNLNFKIKSEKGSFEFLDYFEKRIDFTNFSAAGEYDHKLKILDLSEINADFISEIASQKKIQQPHFTMSLLVSELESEYKKLDFYIKIQNVLDDELGKFWPSFLQEKGVRTWVLDHLKSGIIKNAYAKFSLFQNAQETHLESINSEVVFTDFDLEYSADFPAISNLSGIASFTKNNMKITLSGGEVLKSKISEGLVAIDDFFAPVVMLKISGKSQGHASDSLKHASYEPEFAQEVEKYLNGNSQNEFNILLPLSDEITLKNSYIAVNSTITELDNGYVRGGVLINSKKDFKSTNFVTNIDLTAAELTAKAFDVVKDINVESDLNFVVSLKDPKKIQIKNIILQKKEEVVEKNPKLNSPAAKPRIEVAKISGNIEFETSPFVLSSASFKNNNFGKNNYVFSYRTDKETATQKIFIQGEKINFGAFIEGKFAVKTNDANFPNAQFSVNAKRVDLLNNKFLRNFAFFANCQNYVCGKGIAKANYGKQQFINLRAAKNKKDNFSTIYGRITDVGYIAEALGISNVVSAGDAKLQIQNKIIDKKPALEGIITIDNNITIYESPTVKKLSKDTLFSQVKDKIFSSEKTIFDSVKVEFLIQDKILNINSLVANNYKIGVTAKGTIDLQNNAYQLKGMIVPGFLINNLFGIGKIPLIGGVISGLLTGGEGGGLFGIRYEYVKTATQQEPTFTTNKVAAFVPSTIQNLFD